MRSLLFINAWALKRLAFWVSRIAANAEMRYIKRTHPDKWEEIEAIKQDIERLFRELDSSRAQLSIVPEEKK